MKLFFNQHVAVFNSKNNEAGLIYKLDENLDEEGDGKQSEGKGKKKVDTTTKDTSEKVTYIQQLPRGGGSQIHGNDPWLT